MLGNKLSLFVSMLLITTSINATDTTINTQELSSYVAQKYRVDLNAQTDKAKEDLAAEYSKTIKLSDNIASKLKDDMDFKIATRLISIEIWAQKFMANINPTDSELKNIYTLQKPQVEPRYNLSNILLKDEASADKILKSLNGLDKDKKLTKFKELVKTNSEDFVSRNNEGSLGWIDTNKLDKNIQDKLNGTKKGDLVKVNVPNIGWQVLFVEEYQPKRDATFDEAKQLLVNLAKQEALNKEIEKILK